MFSSHLIQASSKPENIQICILYLNFLNWHRCRYSHFSYLHCNSASNTDEFKLEAIAMTFGWLLTALRKYMLALGLNQGLQFSPLWLYLVLQVKKCENAWFTFFFKKLLLVFLNIELMNIFNVSLVMNFLSQLSQALHFVSKWRHFKAPLSFCCSFLNLSAYFFLYSFLR